MTVDAHTPIIELVPGADLGAIGGKAAGIARLAGEGFPVPPAAVIRADVPDEKLISAASAIAAMFPTQALAIRSSAIGEDGFESSLAGAFESVLNVEANAGAIAEAVRRVRASAGHAAVAVDAMPVLIMPMVHADAAGIAFSRHPVTGADVVVLEAVAGLADQLAAGLVDGERWEIGEAYRSEPSEPTVLSRTTADRVVELTKQIEAAFGSPQDIEWVLDGNDLVVIQARPITAAGNIEPIPFDETVPPGPWEWDSTHSQSPMTPFHATLFPESMRRGSRRLATEYGLPIDRLESRTIGGYFHIQVVPPVGKPGRPLPPAWLFRLMFKLHPVLRSRTAAARRTLEERTDRTWAHRWKTEQRPAFERMMDEWSRRDLTAMTDDDLVDHLETVIDQTQECFAWNMMTDISYLLPLSALHTFLVDHSDATIADTTSLLAGAAPGDYLEAIDALRGLLDESERRALAEGRKDAVQNQQFWSAFETHQRKTGPRGLGYDISEPTFSEVQVDELAIIAADPAPTEVADLARMRAEAVREELPEDLRRTFDDLLDAARSTFPIREESEYVHGRMVGAVRFAALEAGRRMAAAGHIDDHEHVFFAEVSEVMDWLREPQDLSEQVKRRRGQALWAATHPPDAAKLDDLPDPSLFPLEVAKLLRAMQLVQVYDARPPETGNGVGLGVSAGSYTGPVRIVRGPRDFGKVQAGDVVVAPLTTSAWEPIFPLIGALVTEGGGMLSHPAIVAREHGLPAVTGFIGATERFADRDVVTVDGSTGTVIARS